MLRNKLKSFTATTMCVLTTLSSFSPAFAADPVKAQFGLGQNVINVLNDSYILSLDVDTDLDAKGLGDATLAGIVYQLYENNTATTPIGTSTTDEDGVVSVVVDPANTAKITASSVIKEASDTPSRGFEKSTTAFSVTQTMVDGKKDANTAMNDTAQGAGKFLNDHGYKKNDGTGIMYVDLGKTTRNDVIENTATINVKYEPSDIETAYTPKDVNISVYKKSDITTGSIDTSLAVATGKTDAKGSFKATLPYGQYIAIVESYEYQDKTVGSTSVGFMIKDSAEENAVVSEAISTNSNQAYIQVVKKDSETGKTVAVADTTFQILDSEKNPVAIGDETEFTTDETGTFITPLRLPYGDYYLKETKAPAGYKLAPLTAFTVSANTVADSADILPEGVVDTVCVVLNDEAQTGSLTVNIKTSTLASVKHDSATDIYTPVYAYGPVEGASYSLIAAEDILSADGTGTVVYAKGSVASKQASDEEGKVDFTDIALGSYLLIPSDLITDAGFLSTEVDELLKDSISVEALSKKATGANFVAETGATTDKELTTFVNTIVKKVELVYDATAANQTEKTQDIVLADADVTKVRNTAKLTFEVELADGTADDYADMVYGLYTSEKITAVDGTSIPADALIEKMSVSSDGVVKMTADIPTGKYYVKQIATSENYKLDETAYAFEFDGKTSVEVVLKDKDGNPMTLKFEKLTDEEKTSSEASADKADVAPETGDVAPIAALATILIGAFAAMVVASKKRA